MSAKNWLLWPSLTILLMHYAFAQPVPNSIVVGGSARGSLGLSGGQLSVNGTFSPTVGLQVGKLAFGAKMDLGVAADRSFESYRVMGGLWSRYYFSDQKKLTPFAEVAMSQGFTQMSMANFGRTGSIGTGLNHASSFSGTLGYAWFPTKHFALTAGLSLYRNHIIPASGNSLFMFEPDANRTGIALNVGMTGFIPRRQK